MEYDIYLGHRPLIGNIKNKTYKRDYFTLDCTYLGAGKYLSPEFIGPIYDYENNQCNSLANFRQFIKIIPHMGHMDGAEVSPVWRRWKIMGFKSYKRNYFTGSKYSYDGKFLNHIEANDLFEEKYKNHINMNTLNTLIGEEKKILLLDFYIEKGEPIKYTPEIHKKYKEDLNIYLSHLFVLAELISNKKETFSTVGDINF